MLTHNDRKCFYCICGKIFPQLDSHISSRNQRHIYLSMTRENKNFIYHLQDAYFIREVWGRGLFIVTLRFRPYGHQHCWGMTVHMRRPNIFPPSLGSKAQVLSVLSLMSALHFFLPPAAPSPSWEELWQGRWLMVPLLYRIGNFAVVRDIR